MGNVTRGDIEAAINEATGNPDVGPIKDIQPAIVAAIDALINGEPEKETRVVKAAETRETKTNKQ